MLYTTDAQRVIHLFKWCSWVIDGDHCSRGKLFLCLLVLVLLALQCLWCRSYVGSLMILSAGFLDLASYGSWRGVDYSKWIFLRISDYGNVEVDHHYKWQVKLLNRSPKNKNLLKMYSLSGLQWLACFLIGTYLEKFTSLSKGSSVVNGCRQNESPNSW